MCINRFFITFLGIPILILLFGCLCNTANNTDFRIYKIKMEKVDSIKFLCVRIYQNIFIKLFDNPWILNMFHLIK